MNPKCFAKILALSLLLAVALTFDAVADEVAATVSSVTGSVTHIRGTKESPLTTKSVVKPGESIKTGSDSQATITWGAGNVVKIYQLSMFTFKKSENNGDAETTSLDVKKGNVFTKVNKLKHDKSSFEIATPVAIAGVRGSEIFVGADEKDANFSVVSGAFQVSGEGFDVELTQGFQLNLDAENIAAGTVAPSAIPAETLKALKAEAAAVVDAAALESDASSSNKESSKEKAADAAAEAAVGSEMSDVLQDAMEESISNDTITNQAVENAIQELEAGMGGMIITVE